MATRILKPSAIRELQPKVELDYLAASAPRYPFAATNPDDARKWQAECRAVLMKTLGFLDTPFVEPRPEVIEEVDRGDFLRRKIVISTSTHSKMPVYVLVPKGEAGPLPVVIAYHGHGYGVKDIVGLWQDGEERHTADGYQKDFAIELCRKGFLVFAPENSCFGERRTDFSGLNTAMGQETPTTCENTALYAFMLGKSALGLRVRDGMRLADYISTLPEADVSRLGAMGISGGGMLTFFHAAVDERIRACVVSGYYSSFRDSNLAMSHCACTYVPGLLEIGEMCDLVGLILPRPFLAENGRQDLLFPVESARTSIARAKEICRILGGGPDRDVEFDEFEGRHRISGRRSYDFLWEHLALR